MDALKLFLGTLCWLTILPINGHQPGECGLFDVCIKQSTPILAAQNTPQPSTPASSNNPSGIISINGIAEFQSKVLAHSQHQPVAILVCATLQDSTTQTPMLASLHAALKQQVTFFTIDIMQEKNGSKENQSILMELMTATGCSTAQLPLYAFFKHGKLHPAQFFPCQTYNQEALKNIIQTSVLSERQAKN